MFDQSFSVPNFKIIYNLDRKSKGTIEKEYFPDTHKLRIKLYNLNKTSKSLILRYKKNKVETKWFEKKQHNIKAHIERRKEQLNTTIDKKLAEIVSLVNQKGYSLPLIKSPFQVKSKDVYSIGNSKEAVFVSQHIQRILKSLFEIKVSNRDLIVSRLSSLVNDKSPKYIIRADIETFYESIKHKSLLGLLHSSPKLSVTSKRVLTQFIRAYANLTKQEVGLPRGVGISAYLSEVYMKSIDSEISMLADVTYYERYVDDLIIIFSPLKAENLTNYMPDVTKVIQNKQLTLNKKTKEVDLRDKSKKKFEYLGYSFEISPNELSIKLSNEKKQKLKMRINESFKQFEKELKSTPQRAFKQLRLRLRFLTGNTRLYNSKSNAFVGIYFGNKHLTDTSDLLALDQYLHHKVENTSTLKAKRRLKKLSFERGFKEKIYRSFSIKELSLISKVWKYG